MAASKYAAYFSEALSKRISELEVTAYKQLSLRDELALMQEVLGDAIRTYSIVLDAADDKSVALRAAARGHLVECLNQVKEMTLAAKKIEEHDGVLDVSVVYSIMTSIVGFLGEEFKQHETTLLAAGVDTDVLIRRVASRIENEMLVVDELKGTELTAASLEDDVRSMIESVPRVA